MQKFRNPPATALLFWKNGNHETAGHDDPDLRYTEGAVTAAEFAAQATIGPTDKEFDRPSGIKRENPTLLSAPPVLVVSG